MFGDPVADCADKHGDSLRVTSLLTDLILRSETSLPEDYEDQVFAVKAEVRKVRRKREADRAAVVTSTLGGSMKRAVELASEKGGSSVLTVLPLARHGFAFPAKRDFFDVVRMRY